MFLHGAGRLELMKNRAAAKHGFKIIKIIIGVGILLFTLFPIYWLAAMSVRPMEELKGRISAVPQYEVVCKALEGGMYRPVMENWSDFYTILGTELGNIVNGIKTVEQGLEDAQTQLENTL